MDPFGDSPAALLLKVGLAERKRDRERHMHNKSEVV